MSLFLREKYHRGDGNIPSIFLIEYASDKAFFNKFQSLREFFKVKADIVVDPPQKLFPWEAFTDQVAEETWIMSKNPTIVLNSTKKIDYDPSSFSVDAVAEIFKAWS